MLKGLLIGILVSLASFLVILAIYRVEKTRELAKKVLLKIEQWFEKKMEEFEESAKENGVIFTLLGKTALINFVVLMICIVMLLCITLKFNFFIGLGVFIIIFGYYMYKGWIKIPNDPPQKGVITIFGRRMKGAIYIKKEGLIFLAFYPWLQNIMLEEVTTISDTIVVNDVRTPEDNAPIIMEVGIAFSPCNLIAYKNMGSKDGVLKNFEEIILEGSRQWLRSAELGPQTWEEAQGAQEEGVSVLLKAICGSALSKIPDYAQEIPTPLWIKYFKNPQPKPFSKKEKEKAGENWEKVTAVLGKLDKKQKEDLEEAVAKRSNQVRDSRNGKAAIELRQFGIEFTRLTLISIKSEGETAKAADLKAKEIQERRSELFENETDILLAKQLIIESRKNDEHLTTKKAYGIIREFKLAQTRGYVVPGLIETIGNLAEKIVGSKSILPRN